MRLSSIPLHGILRCDRAELSRLDDVLLAVVGADGERGTDIAASFGNDRSVEASSLSSFEAVRRDGGDAAGECQSGSQP